MSAPDDAPDEMTASRRVDDAADRLLRSRADDGAPLGAFVQAVHALGASPPAPTGRLATLLAEGFDPTSAPVPSERVPVWGPATTSRRGLAGLSLTARLLAGTGAALVGLTTAATAGVLPDRLQDRVGGVLEAVTPFEFPAPGGSTAPASDAEPAVPGGRPDPADPDAGVGPVVPPALVPPAPVAPLPEGAPGPAAGPPGSVTGGGSDGSPPQGVPTPPAQAPRDAAPDDGPPSGPPSGTSDRPPTGTTDDRPGQTTGDGPPGDTSGGDTSGGDTTDGDAQDGEAAGTAPDTTPRDAASSTSGGSVPAVSPAG